jgi:hypothetical protein
MEAIRIKTRVESENLVVSVSKEMIGKEVEIILLLESDAGKSQTEKRGLARFSGRWSDDRSAEEIISEIQAGRSGNHRSNEAIF